MAFLIHKVGFTLSQKSVRQGERIGATATSHSPMRYVPHMKENDMRNNLAMVALAALVAGPLILPAPVLAQSSDAYRRDSDGYRRDQVYRGRGGDYRRKCGGGNGAVGTVAGGVGGAVLGSALGGGTLGTVAGGVGGALLGRHLDKKNTESRNGC
jgi:outer membrane lipoprotein SlyB